MIWLVGVRTSIDGLAMLVLNPHFGGQNIVSISLVENLPLSLSPSYFYCAQFESLCGRIGRRRLLILFLFVFKFYYTFFLCACFISLEVIRCEWFLALSNLRFCGFLLWMV